MDDLAKKYFIDPEAYGKAMELLMIDEEMIQKYSTFEELEEYYLSDLDDSDSHLLSKALSLKEERNKQSKDLLDENVFLKETIKTLQRNNSLAPAKSQGKLDIPLNELIKLWLIDKARRTKVSSLNEYKAASDLFRRIICEKTNNQNILVGDIDTNFINEYTSTLYELPPNINKKRETKNKSISEILELNLSPRSQSTVHKQAQMINELFRWGEQKNYQIVEGITNALKSIKKPKKRDQKQRVPFDQSDLEKLFNSADYRQGKFNSSSKFWGPLLALFTGETLGELVQLYIDDIYEKENKWIIDINSKNDKELKVESNNEDEGRPRLVPIHPQLLKLGFLDFVDHQKSNGQTKLFPEEQRDSSNKFSNFSKWFARYRAKVVNQR